MLATSKKWDTLRPESRGFKRPSNPCSQRKVYANRLHLGKVTSECSPPLRRTIHRVSALLETVDLEFDRVLDERRDYREVRIPVATESEPLNVDLLASLLKDAFPPTNLTDDEEYAALLSDMNKLSITTASELKALLIKQIGAVMEAEHNQVSRGSARPSDGRVGAFFAHVGLARRALRLEFGDEAVDRPR